jgi:hypothetical protein
VSSDPFNLTQERGPEIRNEEPRVRNRKFGYKKMDLTSAHLRIARPTNNILALLPFYRDGLGFEVVGQFSDHDGFDGVMLRLPSTSSAGAAAYHLEFTQSRHHDAGQAPSQDNLLVFYLADATKFAAAVARMEARGFGAVASFNPYWDRCGKTFEDPDGYRVVLANIESPV